ncbi:hypothetical protein [Parasphaerochaeta coccoides]|uniref:hypothetical protein n=1 Tax=Parasphaerochaeta coccoides TaxID=273376 RepID=UPI00030077F2|nr:hypothetical protein [Parasphaerochaeta coccoides]
MYSIFYETRTLGIKDYKNPYLTVKGMLTKNHRRYLFLDEIQRVEHREKAVDAFRVDFDIEVKVYPLSFNEGQQAEKEALSMGTG